MDFKKILKVLTAIAALVALAAAAYYAIKKLTAKEEPAYFDDNDFFECDNEIEIVDVKDEEAVVEEPAKEEPAPKKKPAQKKKAPKKVAE